MKDSTHIDSPKAGYRSLTEIRAKLCAILIDEGIITKAALEDLQQRAAWKNEPIESALLREEIISEEDLLDRLSNISGIPRLENRAITIGDNVIMSVPPRAAVHYRIMPLILEEDQIILATDRLRDPDEDAQLRVILGRSIQWMLCTSREVSEFITHFYGIGIETFLDIEESESRAAGARRSGDEAPAIPAFVDDIIRDAIRSNATDIHVEPEEDHLRVRYRIDGVLYPAPMPRGVEKYQRAIISSMKVMAQMNIAERRLPQDGRLEKYMEDQSFDIRVSALPTRYGESIQMRLLNRGATFLRMNELGLPTDKRDQLEELIHIPHGLILFTGPTGSGKTTSLYAGLAELNDSERKIITIEDPVEYRIKGITQLQVQPQIGFTFANGLRSLLRHDPDIILVGEIRDDETADIAVSAALTGHLVLSTLHTNDTAGAATRLVDMGIEPYLVASGLQGIVAQRLIRRICPHCREETHMEKRYENEVRQLFPEMGGSILAWRGRGCPYCRFTGYHGRRAIFEILEIDDEIRSMIVEHHSSGSIMQHATKRGMTTMRKAGWKMVLEGETTQEDLLRVTSGAQRRKPADI